MGWESPLGSVRKRSYDREAMWFFRELFRLVWMIVVATAIAAALASLVALLSSGDLVHDLRLFFLVFGCLLLLFAGAGNRSTASARRVNWGLITPGRGGVLFRGVAPRPGEPTLTASAVFVGSALALIALGLVI
jgi:hypothetical protein